MKLCSTGFYRGEKISLSKLSSSRAHRVGAPRAVGVSAKLAHPSQSVVERQNDKEAILLQRFKGHNAAVTALLVTADTEHSKEFITASLDKSIALWDLETATEEGSLEHNRAKEAVRLQPEGGPIFSVAAEVPSVGSTRRQIFCGNAAKCVATWELPAKEFENKVVLNGHTGWVRALATDGRWLFSAGCNHISQWDLSRSVPRKSNELKIYTGDVTGLATGDGRMFSCGADGSIRSWNVGKKGELTPAAARDKAHKGRVSAILYKAGFLYSVSCDSSVKMWDASTLELVMCENDAHQGGKVHSAALGPDGNLYTGGDDKLVRRWQLGTLNPSGASALYCHHYPVRALAAGPLETLVSADASGEVAVWKI